MESRLISAAPLDEFPIEPFEEHDVAAVVERELTALMRRRAQPVERESVAVGDVVRLRLEGPTAHLTRDEVPVVVGAGNFDAELEAVLPGLTVGEPVALQHSAGIVRLEVLHAQGREVPAASDELMRELTSESDATVAAFRQRVAAAEHTRQREAHIAQATGALLHEVIARSEFEIADADRDSLVDAEIARCRRLAAEEGLEFETMTTEQLRDRVAVESIEEFVERGKKHSHETIAHALLGAHYSGLSAAEIHTDDLGDALEAAWRHIRSHAENTLQPQKDR